MLFTALQVDFQNWQEAFYFRHTTDEEVLLLLEAEDLLRQVARSAHAALVPWCRT
jgi:hypothetical protein